ncbi:MAG: NADH-quinone oxidoreductase subunit A, partial [Candidatus Bathyarchaeia archaeon]
MLSPKSMRSENGKSAYACGEKANFDKLKVSVSHYRYLIYFVILDSSVLLTAFAALAIHMANVLFFVIYLFIVIL